MNTRLRIILPLAGLLWLPMQAWASAPPESANAKLHAELSVAADSQPIHNPIVVSSAAAPLAKSTDTPKHNHPNTIEYMLLLLSLGILLKAFTWKGSETDGTVR